VAGDQSAQRNDGLPTVLDLCEGCAGMGQQRLAGRRQGDGTPVAVQQPPAKLRLQAADLLANGGLRDPQSLRCAGEVGLVNDRDEVRQLPEFHKESLSQ
jgi:hypothetical protein